MKQSPSNFRFRKNHRPGKFLLTAHANKNFYPLYGIFALKSKESGKLTFKQIEAGRRAIRRSVSKSGKLIIRVFTYASLTKRPLGMRMGKGKGNHHCWVCPIKAGQVIYELLNVPKVRAWMALHQASDKLPFKSCVVPLVY